MPEARHPHGSGGRVYQDDGCAEVPVRQVVEMVAVMDLDEVVLMHVNEPMVDEVMAVDALRVSLERAVPGVPLMADDVLPVTNERPGGPPMPDKVGPMPTTRGAVANLPVDAPKMASPGYSAQQQEDDSERKDTHEANPFHTQSLS